MNNALPPCAPNLVDDAVTRKSLPSLISSNDGHKLRDHAEFICLVGVDPDRMEFFVSGLELNGHVLLRRIFS